MTDEKTVRAPFPGVFYRRPDPDSPEFVQVGDRVEVGTVVGLIEVMKMFSEVTSPIAGRVAELVVENEQAVNAGQTLMVFE